MKIECPTATKMKSCYRIKTTLPAMLCNSRARPGGICEKSVSLCMPARGVMPSHPRSLKRKLRRHSTSQPFPPGYQMPSVKHASSPMHRVPR